MRSRPRNEEAPGQRGRSAAGNEVQRRLQIQRQVAQKRGELERGKRRKLQQRKQELERWMKEQLRIHEQELKQAMDRELKSFETALKRGASR